MLKAAIENVLNIPGINLLHFSASSDWRDETEKKLEEQEDLDKETHKKNHKSRRKD
jgi:hypothetical protein